jgi:poly(ADP-ribose) glycohydrolase
MDSEPAAADSSSDMFDSPDEPEPAGAAWLGAPLSALGPAGWAPAPPQPGPRHTVAVRLPQAGPGPPGPHPSAPRDLWDEAHVRLPWSRENLYPVEEPGGRKVLRSRWELVVRALTGSPLTSSHQLERAVLSYNTRYEGRAEWSFAGLHHLFAEVLEPEETEAFFESTLPGMVNLLVSSPTILTRPLPLLQAGEAHSITLSQQQVAVLLVNAFFCTFPRRNVMKPRTEFSNYPMINFNCLFGLNASYINGDNVQAP